MLKYNDLYRLLEEHFAITKEAGIDKGIYDSFDMLDSEAVVERRHAARIFHAILKAYEICDLDDIGAASKLLDLYDCRVCVNHIAQVFLRGIMRERLENIFDGRAAITMAEMEYALGVMQSVIGI